MCGYNAYDWKTIAVSLFEGWSWFIILLLISIEPSSIFSKPAIILSKVDFPHPDGPTKTKNSSSLPSKLKLSIILFWPKDLLTFKNFIVAILIYKFF